MQGMIGFTVLFGACGFGCSDDASEPLRLFLDMLAFGLHTGVWLGVCVGGVGNDPFPIRVSSKEDRPA